MLYYTGFVSQPPDCPVLRKGAKGNKKVYFSCVAMAAKSVKLEVVHETLSEIVGSALTRHRLVSSEMLLFLHGCHLVRVKRA